MKLTIFITSFILFLPVMVNAYEQCPKDLDDPTSCEDTPLGMLLFVTSQDSRSDFSYIYLNKKEILKEKTAYISSPPVELDFDKKYNTVKTIISYSRVDPLRSDDSCTNRVMDFSGRDVIISNEFDSNIDCIDISWVSWGTKNSVITFKDGTKFKYENGHVTMIDDVKTSKSGEN